MHKKFFNKALCVNLALITLIALTALGFSGTSAAQTPQPSPAKNQATPKIPMEIAGLDIFMYEVIRSAPSEITFTVFILNTSQKNADLFQEIIPSKNPELEPDTIIPYNATLNATMTEEKTGAVSKALPSGCFPHAIPLTPNHGTQRNITFPAPPPPPLPEKPDAKPEKQTVTIRLPRVKGPFRNIVIPQNEGEVIKFHP
jgi:hypothetical protein